MENMILCVNPAFKICSTLGIESCHSWNRGISVLDYNIFKRKPRTNFLVPGLNYVPVMSVPTNFKAEPSKVMGELFIYI